MDARHRELSNHMAGTKSFQTAGLTFKDYKSVLNFVEEYSPLMWESIQMPSLFGVLAAPTPGSGQQDAARFVSSKKAGRTPKESDLLASLKDDSPPLLFSSTTAPGCVTLVPKTKGFGANLPNFKDYDETSESQRAIITKWLDEWHIGATSNLDLMTQCRDLVRPCATWDSS